MTNRDKLKGLRIAIVMIVGLTIIQTLRYLNNSQWMNAAFSIPVLVIFYFLFQDFPGSKRD